MAITRNELAEYRHYQQAETRIIDGRAVRFRDVTVHSIRMADVEDPDIMVGYPIYEWQQSEVGQWIMQNSVGQPYWTRHVDYVTYGNIYRIVARLSEQNETFWRLKWSGK